MNREKDLLARTRERLMVKVEQEMRATPKATIASQVDRLVPVVEDLAANAEGRRDLAAICAAYLREHKPETTVTNVDEPTPEPEPAQDSQSERPRRRRRSSGGGGQRGRPRRR